MKVQNSELNARQIFFFPGGNKDTRDRYLLLWLFEDRLKELYAKMLTRLDEVAKDSIVTYKKKAMTVFLDLLVANPEQ